MGCKQSFILIFIQIKELSEAGLQQSLFILSAAGPVAEGLST